MTNLIFVRLRENEASTAPGAVRLARLLCGRFVRSSKPVFVQFTPIYPSTAFAVLLSIDCYVFGELCEEFFLLAIDLLVSVI